MIMRNYIPKWGKTFVLAGNIKNYQHKKHYAGGRPKQPPAQKASVLAVGIGFILPVRKNKPRSVRNVFIGFLRNFSDSSFSFRIKN
jgi:hypothetical protein